MALSKEEQERIRKRWESRQRGSTETTPVSTGSTVKDSGVSAGASLLSDSDKARIAERWNSRFDIDESFVNNFLGDANKFLTQAQTDYNKLDWNSATSESSNNYYKAMQQTENDLSNRAIKIQNYLNVNKGKIDEETYSNLSSYLKNFTSPQFSKLFFDARDFYSQFETEEDYKKYDMGWLNPEAETNEDTTSKRKANYQKNADRIEEIKKALPWNAIYFSENAGINLFLTDEQKALKKELEALEAENLQYKRTQGVLDEYYVPITGEFTQNAAYRNYQNATREELQAYDTSLNAANIALANGGYYDDAGNVRDKDGNIVQPATAPKVDDKLGLFLSATEQDIAEAWDQLAYSQGRIGFHWENIMAEGDNGGWKELTDYEINIYYDLYRREGQAAAYKFLSDMKTELNRRQTQKTTERIKNAPAWQQVALNLGSTPMNVFGGVIALVEDAGNVIQGKDINPYSSAHALQNTASAVREKTAEDITKLTGNLALPYVGTTFGDVYQSIMSFADSALASYIPGGHVLLGMNAASAEMKDLYERGGTTGQILAGGFLSGAAEMFFEKFSIGELKKLRNMDKKAVKSFADGFVRTVVMGGVEASEEMATEIANTISDALVMGTQSDWVDMETFVKNVANAGIGGFISGGLGGSFAAKINNSQYKKTNADIGKKAMAHENFQAEFQGVLEQALQMPQNSEAYHLAVAAQKKIANGKQLSEAEVGALYRETSMEVVKAEKNAGEKGTELNIQEESTSVNTDPAQQTIPTKLNIDELVDETIAQHTGAPADPVSAAVDAFRQSGTVTNKQATDILNSVKAVQQIVKETGVKLDGLTASQKRQAVKNAIEQLAQEQVSAESTSSTETIEPNGIKEQLRSRQDTLSNMQPAVEIQAPAEFSGMDKAGKQNWVVEKLRPTGYKVDRKGFGIIDFAKKRLKAAFKYFDSGSAEEASFEAIPYVLESGIEISSHEDHKGRNYRTVTIAAPIVINGQRGNMAVVVKQTDGNHYKVHRILTPDGSVFQLSETTNEADRADGGVTETGSLATSNGAASLETGVFGNSEAGHRQTQTLIPVSNNIIRNNSGTVNKKNGAVPSGLDTAQQTDYDDINNVQGGNSYAAGQQKMDHGGVQWNAESDSQGEVAGSPTNGGLYAGRGTQGGDVSARNSGTVHTPYSGRKGISQEIRNRLSGTAVADSNGDPIEVYHATNNTEFEVFAEGDTGFHFGSKKQADAHRQKRGYTEGRTIRAYLDIKNPIRARFDIMGWTPRGTALYLWSEGVLTDAEYQQVESLWKPKDSYNSASALRLRQILEGKGYDGIVYPNGFEGSGDSYMVFRDDQIIRNGEDRFSSSPESVGAADSGKSFGENTVGGAQSRFRHQQKESKIYTNTYANATDEAIRDVGKEAQAADPNISRYDYISEEESWHNATQRTSSREDIDYEYDYLLEKNGWTGEDNDTAMRVLAYLRKTGDTARLRNLAAKQREVGTVGGQLTQSFAKYTRTPAYAADSAIVALDAMSDSDVPSKFYRGKSFETWKGEVAASIVETANQIETVEDGNTEGMKDIIRSLANFRHTTAMFGIRSNLTKAAEHALKDIDFQTAKDIATAQLSQIPGDFRKRSVGQVVKTLRIHNMLSALTTVNRNLVGNASIGIMDATVDSTVGRALDALVALATKKRTVGNDVTHAKTYFDAAKKAANMAALCAELDVPMESESRFSTGRTRTYSPQGGPVMRFFSAYEKYMKYALEVTDKFFEGGSNAAVDESLNRLGAKSNLSEKEISELSEMVGQRRTFKEDRKLYRAAKSVKQGLNELGSDNIGLGDLTLPFAGTGSNVAQAAIDYSSGGLNGIAGILRIMKDAHDGKSIDAVRQRQAVTNAARGLTGTGLIAAFTALAAVGVLKVHDDEDKDKRALEQSLNLSGAQLNVDAALRWISGKSTEWQEGDWCISVDFLEPFNAQMYVGYLLAQEESVTEMLKSYPGSAVRGIWQSILDMPLMQGLSDTADLISGVGESMAEGNAEGVEDAAGQMLGNTASGFFPSWMRQTAQYIDPYYRDTTGEDTLEKSINQVIAAIPGLSQTLPKKYSGLGDEQRRYDDPISGFFNTFVNPGDAEQVKSDPVVDFLGDLSERTGKVSIYPESAAPGSFAYGGKTVTISGKEMTESYQKTYGDNVDRLYGELIANSDFLSAGDDLQVKILESTKGYATQLAKAAVSDYTEVPAYIRDRPSGMSEAEAILRHHLVDENTGTTKYTALPIEKASYVDGLLDGLLDKPRETKPDGSNYANVRPIQQIEAIVAADKELTEAQQRQVLEDILDVKAFAKYEQVIALGYNNDEYAATYRLYLDTAGGEDETIRAIMRQHGLSRAAATALYEIYN